MLEWIWLELKPILLVLLMLPCCFALFICSVIAHNLQLAQYESTFEQLQHPPGTSRITIKKSVSGYSTANGCDFFVGELRRYSGPEQEIETFYANQAKDQGFFEDVELLFIENAQFPEDAFALPDDFRAASDWNVSPSDLEGDLYLIYFWTIESAYFDYRCR